MAIPTNISKEAEAIVSLGTGRERFARLVNAFRRDPRLWFGIILLGFVLAAIFAPLISPYPP